MALEIILYDTSPIVQKIFSHILYHYAPVIYRTDQPADLATKIRSSRPDLVFIDYSVSQQVDKKIGKAVAQMLQGVPVILMSQQDVSGTEMPYAAKDLLKKPVDAVQLKELVNRFVPKTKSHLLKDHLQFPPMPDFDEDKQTVAAVKDKSVGIDKQQSEIYQMGMRESKPPVGRGINKQKDKSTRIDVQEDEKDIVVSESPMKPTTLPKPSGGIQVEPVAESEIEMPSRVQESLIAVGSKDEESRRISSDSDDIQVQPAGSEELISQKTTQASTELSDSEEVKVKIFTTSPSIQPEKEVSDFAASKKTDSGPSTEGTKTHVQDTLQDSPAQNTAMKNIIEPAVSAKNVADVKVENATVQNIEVKNDIKDTNKDVVKEDIKDLSDEPVSAPKEPMDLGSSAITQVDLLSPQLPSKDDLEKKWEEFFEKEGKKIIQSTTEKAVWQVVPELAKQLIEKELEKLLKEDKSPSDSSK